MASATEDYQRAGTGFTSTKQHYEVHGVLEKPLAPELNPAGKHLECRTRDESKWFQLYGDTDSFTCCFWMTHLVILIRQHPPKRNTVSHSGFLSRIDWETETKASKTLIRGGRHL